MGESVRLDKRSQWVGFFLLTASFALWLSQISSAATKSESGEGERQCLAVVNGDSIFTSDIDVIFARLHSSMSTLQKEDFDYHKLLNKLVNDRLIVHEAEAVGMADDSAFAALLAERQDDYTIKAYIGATFDPPDSVFDAEVLSYFHEFYIKKGLRTISVASSEEAQRLVNLIRRGADMDSIAKAVSVDIYRYQGGMHRAKYLADIEEELRRPLSELKDGEVTGPFSYRQVYALLRLEQTTPADTSELAKHRSYIVSIIKYRKQKRAWDQFIAGIRQAHHVRVDSTALATLVMAGRAGMDSTYLKGSDVIVAQVDDSIKITDSQLRRRVAHQLMAGGGLSSDSLAFRVLDEAINGAALGMAARLGGFDKTAPVAKKLAAFRDSALIEIYLRETVVSKIKFTHQEFDQYYRDHIQEFREPDEYNLKQVLFDTQEAADTIVALLADGADFDFVTGKYLSDKTKLIDKDQWISSGSFPAAIQEDLAKIAVGGTSNAYHTTDGWLVLKVKDRRPGKIKAESDVEMQIREVIFKRKFNDLMDETLATLRKNSTIVYDNAAIDRNLGESK
jgi:parvulin-like peptidyl-prolyl isomerase